MSKKKLVYGYHMYSKERKIMYMQLFHKVNGNHTHKKGKLRDIALKKRKRRKEYGKMTPIDLFWWLVATNFEFVKSTISASSIK